MIRKWQATCVGAGLLAWATVAGAARARDVGSRAEAPAATYSGGESHYGACGQTIRAATPSSAMDQTILNIKHVVLVLGSRTCSPVG